MNPPLKTKGGAPAKPKADPSRCGARDDSARREGHGGIPPRVGPRRKERALRYAHEECRAEAWRYVKTLKAKADPSAKRPRDDNNSTKMLYVRILRYAQNDSKSPET